MYSKQNVWKLCTYEDVYIHMYKNISTSKHLNTSLYVLEVLLIKLQKRKHRDLLVKVSKGAGAGSYWGTGPA